MLGPTRGRMQRNSGVVAPQLALESRLRRGGGSRCRLLFITWWRSRIVVGACDDKDEHRQSVATNITAGPEPSRDDDDDDDAPPAASLVAQPRLVRRPARR